MGRNSTMQQMTAEDNARADACIRQHRFININAIKAALEAEGIQISRAALHRYMQRLAKRDGLNFGSENDTVIVVMQRSTGAVVQLSTTATIEMVVSHIASISTSPK